jgi:hypothetical protein
MAISDARAIGYGPQLNSGRPMASLTRIPFSPSDDALIGSMNGWMMFAAVMHFIGGAFFLICGCFAIFGTFATFSVSPIGGILSLLQMLSFAVLGIVLLGEGAAIVQARSAFAQVVATDTDDQAQLSTAFKRLKLFFMLELLWFAINVFVAILALLTAIVAPEIAATGFEAFQQGGGGGGSPFGPQGGGQW